MASKKTSKITNPSPSFRPAKGQQYFFVNQWQKVSKATWNNHRIDSQRLRHANVFRDYASANAVRKAVVKAFGAKLSFVTR